MDNQHTARFTREMVKNNEHPGPDVGDSHLPIFIQLQASLLSIMGVKLHSTEEILQITVGK